MEQCSLTLTWASLNPPSPVDKSSVLYQNSVRKLESSEVDENSGVDKNSVKLVDVSSVVVENTGLKREGLDKKAVIYQSAFSLKISDFDPLKWINFRLRLSILDYSALLLRSIFAELPT